MNAQRPGRLGLSLTAALAGAALAPAAFGQGPPSDAASEASPLYRVEIIVFAYNEGDRSEEDFAHIAQVARSESLDDRRSGEIALLDFPYADEEGDLGEDGDPSRLLLGQDEGPASGVLPRNGVQEPDAPPGPGDSVAESGRDAESPSTGALPGAAPAGSADPTAADQAGPGLGPEAAAAAIDPFGGDPGNAVAAFRFRLLEQDELELAGLRQRLERLPDVYTPLVHGGWIQEGLPPEQAKPFDLAYLGASMPSGTIRLHVTRFLHLTLDLDYRPLIGSPSAAFAAPGSPAAPPFPVPGAGAPENALPGGNLPRGPVLGDERSGPVFGVGRQPLSEIDVSHHYHLNAERRMRNGEVHYFDHPFFGVIAVVEPYEPPAPPETGGVRPAA